MGYLGQFLIVVADLILGLFLFCVIVRFLLQYFRADFYNPVSQFIVTVTNPPLKPLRRLIPGIGGLDMAAVVLAIIVATCKRWLIWVLQGASPGVVGTLVAALGDIVQTTAYVFMFAIIIRIVLSWVNPGYGNNPVINLISTITEPVMRPFRNMLPAMNGIDLSPILVFIAIYFVLIVIASPIVDVGTRLAMQGLP